MHPTTDRNPHRAQPDSIGRKGQSACALWAPLRSMDERRKHGGERIDWPAVRDQTDLTAVVAALLGPPAKRTGNRLSWLCPFHDDHSPSFTVDAKGWRCWACGIGGDAAALVMRHQGIGFGAAVRWLAEQAGIAAPSIAPARPTRSGPATRPPGTTAGPPVRAAEKPPDGPKGLAPNDALALVDEAAARLWTPEGAAALGYLIESRGLSEATIRAARLGWTPRAAGVAWKPPGWVIPWFDDAGRLALVKIRPPDEWRERFPEDRRPPKYIEAFRDRPALYTSPGAIRPGTPLIAVEGELDAILLGQELGDLASVVTTGSASSPLDPAMLPSLLRCPEWFAAHDADEAGDRAAAEWPARAIRVRPPEPCKDWGELHASAFNAIRYLCGGILRRPGTPWDELAARRWGPGLTIEGPGFVVDRPVRRAGSRPSKEGTAA